MTTARLLTLADAPAALALVNLWAGSTLGDEAFFPSERRGWGAADALATITNPNERCFGAFTTAARLDALIVADLTEPPTRIAILAWRPGLGAADTREAIARVCLASVEADLAAGQTHNTARYPAGRARLKAFFADLGTDGFVYTETDVDGVTYLVADLATVRAALRAKLGL